LRMPLLAPGLARVAAGFGDRIRSARTVRAWALRDD
jgi:hypothetical protein